MLLIYLKRPINRAKKGPKEANNILRIEITLRKKRLFSCLLRKERKKLMLLQKNNTLQRRISKKTFKHDSFINSKAVQYNYYDIKK